MKPAKHLADDRPTRVWRKIENQLAFLLVMIALGVVLRIANLDGVVNRSPDERNYTWEAATLLQQGSAGVHTIIAAQPNNLSLPSPTRAGYLWLLAEMMRFTGEATPDTGAKLACGASILSLLLLAILACRAFSPLCAIVSVSLLAVSPMALITARRSWQEAFVEALTLALLWLSYEICAGQRRLGWLISFATLGAYALTVKEVAALGFLLCVAAVLLVLFKRGETRIAWLVLGLCTLASGLALGWLAWLLGGVGVMMNSYTETAKFLTISDYSIVYEAGSQWQLALAFWLLSPLTLLLAFTAVAFASIKQLPFLQDRLHTLAFAGYIAIFLLLTAGLPHHMNLRYLCPVFAPLCLLAGVGLVQVVWLVQRLMKPSLDYAPEAVALLLLTIFSARDYRVFRNDYALPDIQDLSLRMVLAAVNDPMPFAPAPEQAGSGKTAAAPAASEAQPPAANWLNLSLSYAQAHQPQRSIDAAEKCLQLDPQNATAWNNIAAGYEELHQWDPAIDAANHALKIQPDFQLARNNLNWSLAQKKLNPGK